MADTEFRDPHRRALMARLDAAVSRPVPPGIWAALWLSDIGELSRLVTTAESDPKLTRSYLSQEPLILDQVLKLWNQKTRTSRVRSGTTTPTRTDIPASLPPTPQRITTLRNEGDEDTRTIETLSRISSSGSAESNSSVKRSEAVKKACLKRDETQCVLTKAGEPVEVAHIYPFSMNSVPQNGTFWDNLSTFWSDEQISRWKSAVFSEGSTETIPNVMVLSPNAHAYWGKALFALKPLDVSSDNKRMNVQLFWLRPCFRMPYMQITDPPKMPNDLTSPGNYVKLFNHMTERAIRSGDIITLRTDDPQLRPLPSRDLLEMQWILHRLTAISGGAEALFDRYGPDDDDCFIDEWGSLGGGDTVDMDEHWTGLPVSFGYTGVQTVH